MAMDGLDLFRKLGVGAKFNYNRFEKDAHKLRITKFHRSDKLPSTQVVAVQEISAPAVAPAKKKRKRYDDVCESDGPVSEASERHELYLLGSMKSHSAETDLVLTKTASKKKKKRNKTKTEKELKVEAKQESVNRFRNQHKIHVYGSDLPDPVDTVGGLEKCYGLHSDIVANVKSLGFDKLTPIQMQSVPVMMQQRDTLACAPTGSGKTLAFILPILHHLQRPLNKGFRALILSPTRELAIQTHRDFQRVAEGTGLRINLIGKTSKLSKLDKSFDILVTTPNRLVYLIQQEIPLISLSCVEWLVVDESDKLFEDGKTGFRDQIAAIYQACDGNKNIRKAMFSATFTFEVEQWCKLNLDNLVQVYIGAKNSATETVEQELKFVGSEAGKLIAVREMVTEGLNPPVLIFVQSKDRAKELYHELVYDGISVDVIHGDRTQSQRDNVVKQFRSGDIWVLICTELMGRGIDFKGVNLVINFDFPNSAISYIHRIGRTGRAGHRGKAVTYFTEKDVTNLKSIVNVMRESGCSVPEYMLKLKKLDKKQRRKLSRRVPKRLTVRTIPKHEIRKAHGRRHKAKNKVLSD